MKVGRVVMGVLLAVLVGGGCSATCTKHEAATQSCKGSVTQKACKNCCGTHGSSTSSYWPGKSGCTCFK